MWPVWKRNQEWRERLAEEATRKALDLPATGLSIFKNGIGWKELAIIAAIAIGGPLAWSTMFRQPPSAEKPPAVDDKDTNTKYTITIE